MLCPIFKAILHVLKLETPKGIITYMHYWAKGRFIQSWNFPRSNSWTDGGITQAKIGFLPQVPLRSLDFDSWIINKVDFLICNKVPVGGAITIQLPTNWNTFYADVSTKCSIWGGVEGFIQKLDSTLKCLWVPGEQHYRITDFQEVPQFTTIQVIYKIKSLTTQKTPTELKIRTWFDKRIAYTSFDAGNPVISIKNENDFYDTLTPPDITGPKIFPNKLELGPFYQTPKRARVGDRGPFYITIITNYNLPSSGIIKVTIPNKVVTLPSNGVLDCRVVS